MNNNWFSQLFLKSNKPYAVAKAEPVVEANGITQDQLRHKIDRNNPDCPFYGIVAQDNVINQLLPILAEAWQSKDRAVNDTLLLTGPPSTGKTDFARRIAGKKGLDIPFVETDGNQIESTEDIFNICMACFAENNIEIQQVGVRNGKAFYKFPAIALFIDEFQALNKDTLNMVLKAFESKDRMLYTEDAVVDFRKVLTIAATTERGDILRKQRALDSRFNKIEFSSYTYDEVAQIVKLNFRNWNIEDCKAVAVRSSAIAREALTIADKVRKQLDFMRITNPDASRQDAIVEVSKQLGIDETGRTNKQLVILTNLAKSERGLNYGQMSALLKCSPEELKQFVLPGLLSEAADHSALARWTGQRAYITEAGIEDLQKRGLIQAEESDIDGGDEEQSSENVENAAETEGEAA